MKKKFGLQCLFGSFFIYALIFALPFLEIPYKWGIGIGLYALSYVFFFGAAALLGSELYTYMPWKSKKQDSEDSKKK
ncbi:MAG: hypothetical protein CMK59_09680 [Proteobacteria bacterium]|nr:hypothetical protein [Pseudomonadota bacterium]